MKVLSQGAIINAILNFISPPYVEIFIKKLGKALIKLSKTRLAFGAALCIILMLISSASFSKRFVVSGKPVHLVSHPGYFSFPSSYTNRDKPYHFVHYENINRVCFMKPQPQFEKLDEVALFLQDHGKIIPWSCYRYNSEYFEVDY